VRIESVGVGYTSDMVKFGFVDGNKCYVDFRRLTNVGKNVGAPIVQE
jgi:hypothetical protein